MSEKDPYSLDDINFDEPADNFADPSSSPDHFDPSIAPDQDFPDSSLEKTLMHEMPAPSVPLPLEDATDVSEPFYNAELDPLENPGESLAGDVLNLAPDVPVHLTAMMGRKSATVKDLLDLKTGDVVEFDRKPMDPLDIVVSGKVIAKAELVVVDGRLGVRILKLFK
ncbi:MAG: FliM/FliN family flagellar motor switch protein [Deltaproteobacteria bacterium]|nr:MAG: FliM/FliN family flagellar motor switch protein [Deltaproteobacteria bacterium]